MSFATKLVDQPDEDSSARGVNPFAAERRNVRKCDATPDFFDAKVIIRRLPVKFNLHPGRVGLRVLASSEAVFILPQIGGEHLPSWGKRRSRGALN